MGAWETQWMALKVNEIEKMRGFWNWQTALT